MGFTNSPLVEYTRISPNKNDGRWDWDNNKPITKITKITIHHWAGVGTLETFGNIVANPSRQMSANYAIDKDARVGLFCEEKDRSWCSSSKWNDNQAVTIEVSNSQTGGQWPISDKVLAKLIDLCVDICKRNGISKLTFTGDRNGSLTYHYMFAQTSCFDPTITELLTPHGWKYLKDINVGDLVTCAHIDNLNLSFDHVLGKVPEYIHDTWKVRDIETTADHRMLVYDTNGHQSVCEMKDFMRSAGTYIPNAGYMNNTVGLGHLSQSDIEFLVAVQADGHYMKDDGKYYGIEFHFSKERKIKRIKKLFSRLNLKYKETHQTNGTTKLRLYGKDFVDNAEMYLNNKCFTWEWLKLSPQQAEWMFDSIFEYDGCKANNSYSSCDRINVDIVQALASIHGIGTKFYIEDHSKKKNHRTSYRVYFKKAMRSRGTSEPKRKQRTTVSCVTVPTGFILVRQHGRTTIIGNCPEAYIRSKTNYICNEVNKRLNPPSNNNDKPASNNTTIKAGDLVSIKSGAVYYNGGKIPDWVASDKWYVASVSGDRAVLGKNVTSKYNIQSPIKTSFLTVVNSNTNGTTVKKEQTISLKASDLIYNTAGGKAVSTVGANGVYTITESTTINGSVYGKLKSGAGWVIISGNVPSTDIVKGSIVSVTNPVIYGTNKKFTVLVKEYTVLSVSGDRCVISADGKNVTAAIAKKYLKKIR